jgi:vacuolar-type H+-ATPase subunit H
MRSGGLALRARGRAPVAIALLLSVILVFTGESHAGIRHVTHPARSAGRVSLRASILAERSPEVDACSSAQTVVKKYEDLESQVEDETGEAERIVDDAKKDAEKEIADTVTKPVDKALDHIQEYVIDKMNTKLNRVLGQIKRADTNIASGYWTRATIYEREWAASRAAMLRSISGPVLSAFKGFGALLEYVQLVKLSKTLGQLATIDTLLASHLHELDGSEAAYKRAQTLLTSCNAPSPSSPAPLATSYALYLKDVPGTGSLVFGDLFDITEDPQGTISGQLTIPLFVGGPLTGTVTGSTIDFVTDGWMFTGTVAENGTLSGTYTVANQTGPWQGTPAG